jgi:hypothetical protein
VFRAYVNEEGGKKLNLHVVIYGSYALKQDCSNFHGFV